MAESVVLDIRAVARASIRTIDKS